MTGTRLFGMSLIALLLVGGCGTTRWTDTSRTATEQLLISDAMDRAVSQLDFKALAGRRVYLDTTHIKGVTDSAYLISTLRQHMLATGCILRDPKEEADYVAEVRVGAIGTDRNEMMFGIPSVSVPVPVAVTGVPASIPEMQLAKNTKQRAVVKMAIFAYNVKTGRPVWQSGIRPVESSAKDVWIAGAGPFQTGSIYDKTNFAGDEIDIPLVDFRSRDPQPVLAVADDAYFVDDPPEDAADETAVAESEASDVDRPTLADSRSSVETQNQTDPDSNVVPAAHESEPSPSTPSQGQTPPSKGSSSGSEIVLRLPETPSPAETTDSGPAPPLPKAGAEPPTPPALLDLKGVNPTPLRIPRTMGDAPARSDSNQPLGLPPLPETSNRAGRVPASIAPSLPIP